MAQNPQYKRLGNRNNLDFASKAFDVLVSNDSCCWCWCKKKKKRQRRLSLTLLRLVHVTIAAALLLYRNLFSK